MFVWLWTIDVWPTFVISFTLSVRLYKLPAFTLYFSVITLTLYLWCLQHSLTHSVSVVCYTHTQSRVHCHAHIVSLLSVTLTLITSTVCLTWLCVSVVCFSSFDLLSFLLCFCNTLTSLYHLVYSLICRTRLSSLLLSLCLLYQIDHSVLLLFIFYRSAVSTDIIINTAIIITVISINHHHQLFVQQSPSLRTHPTTNIS